MLPPVIRKSKPSTSTTTKAPDLSNVAIDLDHNTGLRFWYIESLGDNNSNPKKQTKPHPFANKTVLELGSGTSGLLPLVALAYGAKCVIGTDIDAEVLRRLDENVNWNLGHWKEEKNDGGNLNENECSLVDSYPWGGAEELTWGVSSCHERVLNRLAAATQKDSSSTSIRTSFDIIIASEILYLAGQHKNLAKTIKALCHKDTVVFMAFKKRGLGEEEFFKMAKWAGLECKEVSRDLLDAEFVDDLDHVILELKLI
ncbi:hypothetical protein BDR26DRAFT_931562 [Obelidium mucronatum]|nr:hypothetical protein BDR26DRAFT_931562 [Obelidium mucronatum]